MSVDTEIEGDPASVEAAGTWLSQTLAHGVDGGVDALLSARTSAQGDWDGDAGDVFASTMGKASATAGDLQEATKQTASGLEMFAVKLRSSQHRMAAIRETAAGAGLTVHGFVIESPGDGPNNPGTPPSGAGVSTRAVEHYDGLVADFNAHQKKVLAYNAAFKDAVAEHSDFKGACTTLSDKYRGLQGPAWALNAASVVAGATGGVMAFNASALRGTSNYFKKLGATHVERALKADPAFGKAKWYQDLDDAKKMLSSADDMAKSADDLAKKGKFMPLKLGGALAVVGIGYDISQGKDPVQATTAGAGGFAASVGAGALVGAAVGSVVPVAGTAVGAVVGTVVGAGVGIFTSGAIDSLFENGPDVGAAASAGWDAVTDTGAAIGGAASAVGGAIGGLFD